MGCTSSFCVAIAIQQCAYIDFVCVPVSRYHKELIIAVSFNGAAGGR